MSYDLYFRPRNGDFDPGALAEYFGAREHYRATPRQFQYENGETGVYFSFELQQAADPDEQYPVALNINFLRPSYFILEAEPEVSAFVQHFDMLVMDPQIGDVGYEGEYRKDLLVSGWNQGNQAAYSVLRDRKIRGDLGSLPTATLMRTWTWNRGRKALQAQVGETKLVPRIMFIRTDQGVASAVEWPDGIPAVLPPVDYLIVSREDLAAERGVERREDRALLSWDEARPVLERHGSRTIGEAIALDYDRPPADLAELIMSLPEHGREIHSVAPHEVLDRELVAKDPNNFAAWTSLWRWICFWR